VRYLTNIFILFCFVTSSNLSFAESWKCKTLERTGFSYKNPGWNTTNFYGTEYIIKENPTTALNFEYAVYDLDKEFPIFYCKSFLVTSLTCKDSFMDEILKGVFHFNKTNLRYSRSFLGEYSIVLPQNTVTNSNAADPFVEIGECQKTN